MFRRTCSYCSPSVTVYPVEYLYNFFREKILDLQHFTLALHNYKHFATYNICTGTYIYIYIIIQAGKLKGMQKLQQWNSNIVNHFWYCCRNCDGDTMTMKVHYNPLLNYHTCTTISYIVEVDWPVAPCN